MEDNPTPSMSASYQPRRSARLAAKCPSTPVKKTRSKVCPNAPSKNISEDLLLKFQEMDRAMADTCHAINAIKDLVVARGEHDEYSAEALVSLTRAVWAIDDALELKMRAPILHGDKVALDSVPNFIALLRAVEAECQKDIVVFRQFQSIPRSIMIAIQTIGTTIRSSFYNDH
jgi:hypothetical protein